MSFIFPHRHSVAGQTFGSFTRWNCAAALTSFFTAMVTAFSPGYVVLFFCGMMVLQLAWVKLMMPETKGRTLEQIERDLDEA